LFRIGELSACGLGTSFFSVEPVQKRGEADAAGHGVELRQHKTVIGQQQVGPQHIRKDAAVFRVAGVDHEFARFAAVEVVGHPRGEQRFVAEQVFARDRAEIERFERLVKLETGRADGLQPGHLVRRQRPRFRREPPALRLEERLGRQRGADGFVGEAHGKKLKS